MSTAAGIIIGDEVLSGKVEDTNTPSLVRMLREAGVSLQLLVTIPDDPAVIAEELRRCAAKFDHVFTSGGVGPTHDDRTIEGVARAFDRKIVREPFLEEMIRDRLGDVVNEAALRLADIPEGATLMGTEDNLWPVMVFRNIFILPGVPQIFGAKLKLIQKELRGTPRTLRTLYLSCDEISVADLLATVDREFADVQIGSYPRMDDGDHKVRVTVESLDPGQVTRAESRLLSLIEPAHVVRVEGRL